MKKKHDREPFKLEAVQAQKEECAPGQRNVWPNGLQAQSQVAICVEYLNGKL